MGGDGEEAGEEAGEEVGEEEECEGEGDEEDEGDEGHGEEGYAALKGRCTSDEGRGKQRDGDAGEMSTRWEKNCGA